MNSFLESLDTEDRIKMEQFRSVILQIDNKVVETVSNIMSITNALVYEQERVFKYGLAQTKHHFTFHSMVMYSNPDISDFIKQNSKEIRIQKGCINFTSPDELPIDLFKRIMVLSVEKDFSQIISHYNKKKR